MTIQLPQNGTGTVLSGRTVPREGDRQFVLTSDRGQPGNHAGSRLGAGELLFVEDFRHPVTSFWNDGVGGATRDNACTFAGLPTMRLDPQGQISTAVTVATPTGLTVTPVASGGTFTAGTYFYKITAANLVGETLGSTEVSASIVTNGSANLSWTAMAGAVTYNVARSTTTGTELYVTALLGVTGTTATDTGTATSGAINTTATTKSPSRTAATSGVVAKRRIIDGFTGKFGVECWFRFTSTGWSNDAYPILALYNRDGTSAWHGRVWLNPMGNNTPMQAWILDGALTAQVNGASPLTGSAVGWRSVATSVLQNGTGQHSYVPSTGSQDRAGGWHYCKLVMDMANKKYVELQLDGSGVIDLSAYSMDQTTSAGAPMMHFSVEAASATSSLHYMHIARVIGTVEQ